MSPERFEHLLTLVSPYIQKKSCRSRDPISPAERLVLTLRYLASGDSQQSQSFNFRLGKSTICHIIWDTCIGIWNALSNVYLKSLAAHLTGKLLQKKCLGNGIFHIVSGQLMGSM